MDPLIRKLDDRRRLLRLTYKRLGELSGVHPMTCHKILSGKADVTLGTLRKLAKALDVTLTATYPTDDE